MGKIRVLHFENIDASIYSIATQIRKKVEQVEASGVVIGLSGGVDSTTVACLAEETFKDDLDKVIGVICPNDNSSSHYEDALKVANKLKIKTKTIFMNEIFESYRKAYLTKNVFQEGNMRSRARATLLNTIAADNNMLLLGTGNRDEDQILGYYTLFGDGAVHYSPIGALPKRLVREMCCKFGFPRIANKEPTAELEPNQTDYKDLGYSYEVAELIFEGTRQVDNGDISVVDFLTEVNKAWSDNLIKSKYSNITEAIIDVCKRETRAQMKAQILHPEVAMVSLEYK